MKKLGDVMTIILLLAAFGIAFYTGFIGKNDAGDPMLGTNVLAIISIIGTALLLAVGAASTMYARVKNNMVTVSFTAFCCVQLLAFIGMCTIMIMLWTGMFDVDSKLIQILFIIFTLTITMGYVDALLYADNLEIRNAELANDSDDTECEEAPAAKEFCSAAEQSTENDVPDQSDDACENAGDKGDFMGF